MFEFLIPTFSKLKEEAHQVGDDQTKEAIEKINHYLIDFDLLSTAKILNEDERVSVYLYGNFSRVTSTGFGSVFDKEFKALGDSAYHSLFYLIELLNSTVQTTRPSLWGASQQMERPSAPLSAENSYTPTQ